MPRPHPDCRAPQGAPRRPRADPPPPGCPPWEPRPAGGAGRPDGWRPQGGPDWWQASGGESWAAAARRPPPRQPQPRMPPLPAAAQRAARRSGLRSLLLPPRFLDRAPWTRVLPDPEPRANGKDRRGSAWEAQDPKDSLSALLGQFLPTRFQKFLRQLGAQWVEQLERQSEAGGRARRGPGRGLSGFRCVGWGLPHHLSKTRSR